MKAENINISYEDALKLAPLDLRNKIQHSVELIRKAEKLALIYDPENGYFLAFSGGKDSQCIYHLAKMAGVKFKAHMSLTSVDPVEVIRFVKTNYPDVDLIKPKASIYTIARNKKMLPTMFFRWCCAEYKENTGAGKVTITGVRRQESARRAKRNSVEISRHKFSGDFEDFEIYRDVKLSIISQKKGKQVQSGCISGKDSIIINPIIDWTEKDVWYFLNNIAKVPHCKLYDKGNRRIGCLFCPMSSKKSIMQDVKNYPHLYKKWLDVIMDINIKNNTRIVQLFRPYVNDDSELCIAIFDWWTSKTSIQDYINNNFKQLKINFYENEENQENIHKGDYSATNQKRL